MIPVANTANTNTWEYFINRVNEMANHFSKAVVTSDGSGNNNVTNGNVIISGGIMANTISVGNTSANLYIRLPNTQIVSTGNHYLNANGSWTELPVYRNKITTTGTSTQNIDSFSINYNVSEYTIYIKDNSANNQHTSKILVTYNGSNSDFVEYATMVTNNSLGVFGTTQNASHVTLQFTPTTSSSNVSYFRNLF